MPKPVILTADSTCDLGAELTARYNVALIPIHITYGETSYDDGVNILPDELYKRFYDNGELPKTAAINVAEYVDFFTPFITKGFDVVHIGLGGALSCCPANAMIAAGELAEANAADGNIGRVYALDSFNLSTGSGMLVIEAAERIAAGMPAERVAGEIGALRGKVQSSFVLETLKFMVAGGRCSSLAAFGANLLGLKPSIRVDNTSGGMGVDKKYRGNMEKVLPEYIADQFNRFKDINPRRAFITHSGVDDGLIRLVREAVESRGVFDEILVTRAGCTISSHCGPGTLGLLFMTN
ncbi:MAG: DegV family protein [Oscillospiraceae bacterium]|nr:DegV family protein [Oscillospiraceae bacterium]